MKTTNELTSKTGKQVYFYFQIKWSAQSEERMLFVYFGVHFCMISLFTLLAWNKKEKKNKK